MTENLALKFRNSADKVRDINGEYLRAETNKILFELEAAAGRGLYEYQPNYRYPQVIIDRLKAYGFKITLREHQRDGFCDIISWK